MRRFFVPFVVVFSVFLAACGPSGGGGSTARYTVKVEDVGTAAPTAAMANMQSVSTSSIAIGCEGFTYTHVPTEAWGLDDHYNTRYIRATVFDRGEVLQGAKVRWAPEPSLLRVVEERDGVIGVVPTETGVVRLVAAYEDAIAVQTIYIYDSATFGTRENHISGFDLDGDGRPDIEVTLGSASLTEQFRFPSGGSLVETAVDFSAPCSHRSEEVLRFYQLKELPDGAVWDSDWQRATTGTYVVRTSGGDHYKVLVGLVSIRSGTLQPNEITIGIQYVAEDGMGRFPY